MKRFAAHLICPTDAEELHRAVIELDNNGCFSRFISLDDASVEPAQTLFLDGIITPAFVSIKEICPQGTICPDLSEYCYVEMNVMTKLPETELAGLPFIFDFGSSDVESFNQQTGIDILSDLPLCEIINACIFRPARALSINTDICKSGTAKLIHWQNVDIVNRKITPQTRLEWLK